MNTAVHPLKLLIRNDAEVSTLYHSFFFVELGDGGEIRIVKRVPQKKLEIDNVESGLMLFLSDVANNTMEEEIYGGFVVTSSDGSRYYCAWRGLKEKIFVAVSQMYMSTFSRQLLNNLSSEPQEHLYEILIALSETPILPLYGITYNVKLMNTSVPLRFSCIEQTEDIDINIIVTSLFNPRMLVSAWESILLERKVLVVSSNETVVAPCCEFLRRLVIPFVTINTFIPFLPEAMIEIIDAPVPYLVGAKTEIVLKARINLSEIVVVDLDNRVVTVPARDQGKLDTGAPPNLIARLNQDLNELLIRPLHAWLISANRCSSTKDTEKSLPLSEFAHAPMEHISDRIANLFIETNLSLLTARANASPNVVPSFFRRHQKYLILGGLHSKWKSSLSSNSNRPQKIDSAKISQPSAVGFSRVHDAFAHGTMQMLTERYTDDTVVTFLPCWIEMDDMMFSVYEQADELPLSCFFIKDIKV